MAAAVRALDPATAAIIISLLALLALASGVLALRCFFRLRLMEDTATSTARGAAQGYGEFEGRARPREDAPIIAPLTGLPCCWYRYRVEMLEQSRDASGRRHRKWRVIQREESDQTFWLEDHTGRIVVDPVGGELHPRHRDTWQARAWSGGINRPLPPMRGALLQHFGNQRYRFTEERINANDPLYALGHLRNLGDPAGDAAGELVQLLREWKADRPALISRFDTNRDGELSQAEWEKARSEAQKEVAAREWLGAPPGHEGVNLLGRPPGGDLPYILSAWSQRELLARKRYRTTICGAIFFLAGGLAAWICQTRFL